MRGPGDCWLFTQCHLVPLKGSDSHLLLLGTIYWAHFVFCMCTVTAILSGPSNHTMPWVGRNFNHHLIPTPPAMWRVFPLVEYWPDSKAVRVMMMPNRHVPGGKWSWRLPVSHSHYLVTFWHSIKKRAVWEGVGIWCFGRWYEILFKYLFGPEN